jgi:hypothetical protein
VVLCYWYGRHTEYHKLPRILSVCRNHNPVISSFLTYQKY